METDVHHIDIPTLSEVQQLAAMRHPASVTIVMETTPVTQHAQQDRIKLSNLAYDALQQLNPESVSKKERLQLEAELADLVDDDEFWAHQSESLVIFATPKKIRTYRLPNHLEDGFEISDRFHLPPLMRALAFPHTAIVLVLGQNGARVLEMAGDRPVGEVRVPEMPESAAKVAGKTSILGRSAKKRIQGSEGQKVHLLAYARRVDEALRPLLAGGETPLVLVANEPMRSVFLSVCSYDFLLDGQPEGVAEESGDQEIAAASRVLIDAHYADVIVELRDDYGRASGHRRASCRIGDIARSATFGGVDTLLLDMETSVPGTIDAEAGEITYADQSGPGSYDVLSEIAARVIATGGHVYSVRAKDLPGNSPVAAILRHPI